MVKEIERGAKELQCEAALVFLPPPLYQNTRHVWEQLGYTARESESLSFRAWREAAEESQPPNTIMLFKQLRTDKVLRPI